LEMGMGKRGRRGEEVGQAEGLQTRDGCAVAFDYTRCDRAGAGDADLLADDRPYAGLERIPGSGCANPRPAAKKGAYHGVGREMLVAPSTSASRLKIRRARWTTWIRPSQ